MKKKAFNKTISVIARHYGLDNQLNKLKEELAEAHTACGRLSDSSFASRAAKIDQLAEELADVEIMISQIEILISGMPERIERCKEYKLSRQMIRIREEAKGEGNK